MLKNKIVLSTSVFLATSGALLMAQSNSSGVNTNGQNQDRNVITTAVPFLLITPESRGGGMGDTGVATSADANSLYWNPAKLSFAQERQGASASYTPWLTFLVNDMSVSYLSGYTKLDKEGRQALGLGMTYFNLGNMTFTDENGQTIQDFNPREFAFNAAYSMRLSDRFSIAGGARYIHSNLTGNILTSSTGATPGNSASVDLACYYQSNEFFLARQYKSYFAFGANISNIGTKMTYNTSDTRDFIPTNMRIGASLTTDIDESNRLTLAVDLNKLLVPTPPIYLRNAAGTADSLDLSGKRVIEAGKDPNRPVFSGIVGSFFDAPGGFREELNEFTASIGIEYWYRGFFALRGGYFTEHVSKGERKYFTFGFGLKYSFMGFNFAYLLPTTRQHPLSDTLRFSLLFDISKAFSKDAK